MMIRPVVQPRFRHTTLREIRHRVRPIILGVLVLVVTALAAPSVSAQQNPFFSGGDGASGGDKPAAVDPGSEQPSPDSQEQKGTGAAARKRSENPLRRVGNRGFPGLTRIQRNLYTAITGTVESLGEDPSFIVAFSLFGIMFLYGFLHAMGPGHRKVVLTSYFLSEKVRPLPGVLMAGGTALLHGVSAILLIGTLYFALDTTIGGSFNSASLLIERISYGILIALGFYLIVHTVREGRHTDPESTSTLSGPISARGRRSGPSQATGPDGGIKRIKRRGLAGKIAFVVTNGAVPCPGAALVLVFTFTYGLYTLGILSVLVMSFGMGVLLALVAGVVILGKEKGLKKLLSGSRGKTALRVLEIGGGGAVGIFGLLLLLGSL
jgi:ABC-type nickel/cobalt efflux system permease component RcnA